MRRPPAKTTASPVVVVVVDDSFARLVGYNVWASLARLAKSLELGDDRA